MQKWLEARSDRERQMIYVTGTVLLLCAFVNFFLAPLWDKTEGIKQEINQQKVSIRQDKQFLSYKEKINRESKLYDQYIVESIESDDVINEEFLRTVEKLASRLNVNLIKSNPTHTKKEKEYIEYYANLDCAGDLKDIVSFMHAINTTEDLLKITKFNMLPKRGSPTDVSASMTVSKLVMLPVK